MLVDMREVLLEDLEPSQVLVALSLAILPLCTVLIQNEIQCKFAHRNLNNSNQIYPYN